MTNYTAVRVLEHTHDLTSWFALALSLLPEDGEVHVLGMVTIADERSLSEGVLSAHELRDDEVRRAGTGTFRARNRRHWRHRTPADDRHSGVY